MTNVEMKVDGKKLTITIDLSKTFGPSRSGKSITIATTGGNKQVPKTPETYIGVNVYKMNA